MLSELLQMCVVKSGIRAGQLNRGQVGITRVYGNDSDALLDQDYFFPSMKVAKIKICSDFVDTKNGKQAYISTINFSLDADSYEKVSGKDNFITLQEHGFRASENGFNQGK